MGCDFLLDVKGVQKYRDQEPDVIELTTEASLTGEEGVLFLQYAESDLTGLKGTDTIFELHRNKVVLRRIGAVSSEMVFASGEVHQSLYNTEEGALLITVHTTAVEDEMTLNGGSLHVSYDITIEGLGMGHIDYWLRVRPKASL
ncbi:MAG: DUF1934 domain-containing protein [Oscillospiraceae bacterium]|nr:DUF1934 domain-containing protein [Oscillospiraceae bacterium]